MILDCRFRSRHLRLPQFVPLLIALCAALPGAGAQARDFSVVALPDSLVVIPPQRPPEPVALIEPAERDRALPWRFAQWNNPHPFGQATSFCENGSVTYRAQSASGSFKLNTTAKCGTGGSASISPSAPVAFSISQNGSDLACERGRFPIEYDANFAPQRKSITAGMRRIPLTELSSLHHGLSVTVERDEQAAGAPCRLNAAGALSALVFINPSKRETLFYHLILHDSGEVRERKSAWWATGNKGVGGWRPTAGQKRFGFRDTIGSFGLSRFGAIIRFDADVLPRIKAVIREGASLGMDQDLNNWRLGSTYFGQHIWGKRSLATTWTHYSLRASTAN
jgi:hypothetical protein